MTPIHLVRSNRDAESSEKRAMNQTTSDDTVVGTGIGIMIRKEKGIGNDDVERDIDKIRLTQWMEDDGDFDRIHLIRYMIDLVIRGDARVGAEPPILLDLEDTERTHPIHLRPTMTTILPTQIPLPSIDTGIETVPVLSRGMSRLPPINRHLYTMKRRANNPPRLHLPQRKDA
jgi:hypothetical protein